MLNLKISAHTYCTCMILYKKFLRYVDLYLNNCDQVNFTNDLRRIMWMIDYL